VEFLLDGIYNHAVAKALKGMDEGDIMAKAFGIIIDLANIQVVFRSALAEGAGSFGEFVTDGGHMLSQDSVRELFALKSNEIAGRLENTEYLPVAQATLKNYEKERSVTVIDRVIEKHRIKLLRELLSPRALSPSNLLWYLLIKELEVRNLRLIFKTLMDGIPPSDVRDYVVPVS
jgi:vacuolar-type H+-ATPase subunit C/Vma6